MTNLESCPVCGLNCEEDVKRVWPDAYHHAAQDRHRIYKGGKDNGWEPISEISRSVVWAWHSAAQRPEVEAARMRESMDTSAKEVVSRICESIAIVAKEVASWSPAKREAADVTSPELEPPSRYAEAMREAGKAAERVVVRSCIKCGRDIRQDGNGNWIHHLENPAGDCKPYYATPAPVEAEPKPKCCPKCLRTYHIQSTPVCLYCEMESMPVVSPPAPERGEPKGILPPLAKDSVNVFLRNLNVKILMQGTEDTPYAKGNIYRYLRHMTQNERDSLFRAVITLYLTANPLYELGFNACREMAAEFCDRNFDLSNYEYREAIRNLKQPEGK